MWPNVLISHLNAGREVKGDQQEFENMELITGLILPTHTASLPSTAPAWLNHLPTTWIFWAAWTLKPAGTPGQDSFASPCLLGMNPAWWELLWAAFPGLSPAGNVCVSSSELCHASLGLQLCSGELRWSAKSWNHCSSAALQAAPARKPWEHPELSSPCSPNLFQHSLEVPAAIWRPDHLTAAQMLWSGGGELGTDGNFVGEEKQGQRKQKPVLQAKPWDLVVNTAWLM